MKKLNFSYEVNYSFSQPVSEHCFALRILPVTDEEQGIYASEYSVFGGSSLCGTLTDCCAKASCGVSLDGFGNRVVSGRLAEPHDRFSFCVTGTAYTDRRRPCKWEARPLPIYCFATSLTRPGERLETLYGENRERIHREAAAGPDGEMRSRARLWMHLLAEHFSYVPGATDIHTTAEEAFTGGAGVCQDYAQILLALLRLDGIPARYIAGMLIGEGATHAWCEAWCDGVWIGLDPTHDRELDEDYIQVARGRDYTDCIMDRGSFRGFAVQSQEVTVKVAETLPQPVDRWSWF